MTRAVVFAYHNVGVRCLSVLLAGGVDVQLVITHQDQPSETIWFDSVAELAALHDIPVITPDDPNTPEVVQRIRALQPDLLFSFYYRHMLKPALLTLPSRGAYNMHGSLLPKYRGRVPVNWAIIQGETETGATLHEMVAKPDAGGIVAQQAIPILPNDTAAEVFNKVTVAAEIALHRCLPELIAGTAKPIPQNLSQGAYFGGRKPEDGRIHWNDSAQHIHNLVRAVAPPYPGAYCVLDGQSARILRTLVESNRQPRSQQPSLYCEQGRLYADCGNGSVLRIVQLECNGEPLGADRFSALYGLKLVPLDS